MPTSPNGASPKGLAALLKAAAISVSPRRVEGLGAALAAARRAGVPRSALAELGLMLRLYAGFPASIEFLRALERAWPARTIGPVGASKRPERAPRGGGVALCRRVYGPEYARLRAFMRRLHPDLDRWMIAEGYGRTLTRPGLSVAERELATVAVLAALDWRAQLVAHERGARRVGASAAQVAGARRIGTRCRARTRS